MDLDIDIFPNEYGPIANHARGGFQPKANPRLRKEITELADVVDKDNARDIPVHDGRLEREDCTTGGCFGNE
ncbi:hypothetical protein OWV82_003745 [Melia azedarach]|uniref:Uncharacterized protein n=1 Tax=Melia azedarach TaxID=155640 RepID=A0ACC1YP63_MELAZ|nr:hypothetical protein OWV82_003745 [Melia azedarach]